MITCTTSTVLCQSAQDTTTPCLLWYNAITSLQLPTGRRSPRTCQQGSEGHGSGWTLTQLSPPVATWRPVPPRTLPHFVRTGVISVTQFCDGLVWTVAADNLQECQTDQSPGHAGLTTSNPPLYSDTCKNMTWTSGNRSGSHPSIFTVLSGIQTLQRRRIQPVKGNTTTTSHSAIDMAYRACRAHFVTELR